MGVGVEVDVCVVVLVGVFVAVLVGVFVGVSVFVGVCVGVEVGQILGYITVAQNVFCIPGFGYVIPPVVIEFNTAFVFKILLEINVPPSIIEAPLASNTIH